MRPPDPYQVDVQLEEAFEETRRRVRRVPTGRVFLELHRLLGVTVEHRVDEDRITEQELERLMREPPQPKEKRMRQPHNPGQDADAR